MYTPACDVFNEENVRLTVVVLSSMTVSVTVISSVMIEPLTVIHCAEGLLVRPSMSSITVQVRVKSLPACTKPVFDVTIITSSASFGTREMAWVQQGLLTKCPG